jgi:D-glycero-D-manno-heptose 1,7-bisphosphate phosphatase
MTNVFLNKAIFFDRDGVLNVDTGYPHRIEDCQMITGADKALRLVNDCGYLAFIVTNQGGIALGLYDHADLDTFNTLLLRHLTAEGGIITDIAYCPHHPQSENPALRECSCRKPKPGMLTELAKKHNIDLGASIMIGDRDIDITAAEAAGCRGYLFENTDLYVFIKPLLDRAS